MLIVACVSLTQEVRKGILPSETFNKHALSPQFLLMSKRDLVRLEQESGYLGPICLGRVIFHVLWSHHRIERLYFSFTDNFDDDQDLRFRQTAILDVLCLFAQGRSRPELSRIELREIENYLRERPEYPLWDGRIFSEMHQWFRQLMSGFIGGLEGQLMQEKIYSRHSLAEIQPLSPVEWKTSDMLTRVRWIEHLLELFIRPVLAADGGGIALIDVDDDSLVISFTGVCRQCRGGRRGTLLFIQQFFFSLSKNSVKLKVVDEESFTEAS
ncbi:MAG: NifU family protein [Bdellovibrio sp.]|nr:NifU family protein [Bdellovibrio sp.]